MEDTEIEILGNTKAALFSMFNLNQSSEAYHAACQQNASLVWKVLVLDSAANKVMAPVVHLTDLHMNNVVLHLPLKSKREPLRSVTIIYLVAPTAENVQIIVQDCKLGLYDQIQINFLHPPPEQVVADLAKGLADAQALSKVLKVFEQGLNYVVLERNLFTLDGPSFLQLNSPGVTDQEVEDSMSAVASSLFSVIRTCKIWPIIKAGPGLSEMVAGKLAELCWDSYEEAPSINRPLMLILDRTTDFNIMFHHPWTYQALLFDVFENETNKLTLPSGAVKELDKSKDRFLCEQGFSEFDQVLQNIDKQFNEWKEKYDRIGDNLMSAMENVEELTENKNIIDLHMMLATELVKRVKERHLDVFNSIEESLIKNNNTSLDDIMNKHSGAPEFADDLLRLQIIAFLSKAIEFDDRGTGVLKYLKSIFKNSPSSESKLKSIYGKFKKFIDNDLVLPVTRCMDEAIENKGEFLYFDSKFRERPKYKGKFDEVLVFVVGGGSYAEYQNLMHYGQNNKKHVVYGCSSLNSPAQFLSQIKSLAELSRN